MPGKGCKVALYSKAIQKPITVSKGRRKMAAYNRVNLHVAVSEAASIHAVFNRAGAADSHFYVRKDGTVEQYVDTAYRANADYEGNDATISIETQGGVSKPDTEPWTDKQIQALAELYAWAVKKHGIKNQIAKDSRLGDTSKGLSWHRLGIDGNFPAGVLGGRVGAGMKYSTSRGKACPGSAKILQIPAIFEAAQAIINPPKKKGDWYHVTGVSKGDRLMGRIAGRRTARVRTKRANGFNLFIVKTVKSDEITWGVTNYGTHYSMQYLKKGKA